MRRREEAGVAELVHHRAAFVDTDRGHGEAARRDQVAVQAVAEGLDRDGAGAAGDEHGAEQPQGLAEAGADDDLRRLHQHSPNAREVAGELLAELGHAARVAVAERRIGRHRQRPSRRRQPGRAREGAEVRDTRPQVEPHGGLDALAGGLGRLRPWPARRPRCPTPGARRASPRRRAGRTPRPPCCGRSRGRRRASATRAGGCPAPAARPAPPRAARPRAPRARLKWPVISPSNWPLP